MSSERYTRSRRVAWQSVEAEAVLVDLGSGATLGLNGTASWIWSRIGEQSADEIAESLASEFDVSPADAHRDVTEFVQQLLAEGLVTREDAK